MSVTIQFAIAIATATTEYSASQIRCGQTRSQRASTLMRDLFRSSPSSSRIGCFRGGSTGGWVGSSSGATTSVMERDPNEAPAQGMHGFALRADLEGDRNPSEG